ncbi:MAG: glycosyltransferase, partial [Pseudomonadales bacterium]
MQGYIAPRIRETDRLSISLIVTVTGWLTLRYASTFACLELTISETEKNRVKMDAVQPQLSIIAPLYNEEESVTYLHKAIREAMDPAGYSYEIIFVNDGSKDKTADICENLAAADERLRFIEFRKNYGQTPA